MTPGMKLMVGIVERHFKIHWLSLTRDELLAKYQMALEKENSWLGIPWSEFKDEGELTAKALRLAMLHYFVPHWREEQGPMKAEQNPNLPTLKDVIYRREMIHTRETVISFEDLVGVLRWGTYGKDGNEPLKYVRLIDCTTEHLMAIYDGQAQISDLYKRVICYILESRQGP